MIPQFTRGHLGGPRHTFTLGPWGRNNIAASQSNIVLGVDATVAFDAFEVPFPCLVVGISIIVANGGAAGTITFTALVDGADPGTPWDFAVADSAATVYDSTLFSAPLAVAAGSRVGIAVSTSADWNGTGADLNAHLILERP